MIPARSLHLSALLWIPATAGWALAAPPGQRSTTDSQPKPAGQEVQDALNAGSPPAAATVERIMEQAVRNIAVRYNLNAAQSEKTREIMTTRVHRFLREHEDQVWPVIRELIANGFKPSTDKEQMMRAGKAAVPLMQTVKEAILSGNEEWRLILNAEQKKLHDYDLGDMQRQFDEIDRNFQDWAAGRYQDRSVFPEARVSAEQPPRPTRPEGGLPPPELDIPDPNLVFDALLEEFIKEYELDDGQITAGQSILQEFKANANEYRASKKAEFTASLMKQQEMRRQGDLDGIKKAWAEYKELVQPIHDLCGKMEERLRAQLTSAQIARHADKQKAAGTTSSAKPAKSKPDAGSEDKKTEPTPKDPDAKPERAVPRDGG